MSDVKINCELTGLRPLMFDRYAGDNNTQLPLEEKMYLDKDRRLTIPAINIFSMLCAENTKSVCRQFLGRPGKTIGLGIASYVNIEPVDILIQDDDGPIFFSGLNGQISEHVAVARLAKGVPNPKSRPLLSLPWRIEFEMTYIKNEWCTLENLKQAVLLSGALGLGTFRPFFGRFRVSRYEEYAS